HSWKATFQAKNGSVEKGERVSTSLLINGHYISLRDLMEAADDELIRPSIERYVSGIRGEFLKEAEVQLLECARDRKYEDSDSSLYFKSRRLALEAYVEWATCGTSAFEVEQLFQYSIDHYYSDGRRLPDVFLATIENNNVVLKNIPFPPQPE